MPAAYFKRLGIDEPPAGGGYFVSLQRYVRNHLQPDEQARTPIDDQRDRALKRPWTAKLYPVMADWLKANDKPLALTVQASKRLEYFNPLVPHRNDKGLGSFYAAMLPNVQKCRELVSALTTRAMLRIGEGKFDEAWQDLLACHRLARLVARGPTMIEALVGVATEQIASDADLVYLERGKQTAQQIQERLKELQNLPPLPPLADKIDFGERCIFLDNFPTIRRGGISLLEHLADGEMPEPDPEEVKRMEQIDWEPALRLANQWHDRFAAALRIKDRTEREKELDKIEKDLKALHEKVRQPEFIAKVQSGRGQPDKRVGQAIGEILIGLMTPAFRKVQGAYDRREQVERNLHVAFALAAYHADKGRYPAKLDELVPKYLAEVPNDLFSGEALIYRPAEDGYLLYSVGNNGKDDGGRWYDDQPPGDDPRVRMPLPELKLLRN